MLASYIKGRERGSWVGGKGRGGRGIREGGAAAWVFVIISLEEKAQNVWFVLIASGGGRGEKNNYQPMAHCSPLILLAFKAR